MQVESSMRGPVFQDTFFVTGGGVNDTALRSKDGPVNATLRPRTTSVVTGRHRTDNPAYASPRLVAATTREIKTADESSWDRRICFRSEPIRNLVSATLKSIDPSGMFNTYQEWSDVKNRVLSSEQRPYINRKHKR